MSSYDSPWKEALYQHLRLLLMLLFPRLAARIDWREDHESLEQELRQMDAGAEAGVRVADALLKVRLLTGDERILHAEVQAQRRAEFERRAYGYNYRGHDRFGQPPEALVILADDDPNWRPTAYRVELDYSRLAFGFEPAKLLDWREVELREHENPMGLFVLAHLEALRTKGNDEERERAKLGLLLALAARKLDEDETRLWYRYLDWFLDLPREVNARVYSRAMAQTQEKGMPFVTFAEQYELEYQREEGEKKGKREGLLRGLEAVLEVKFGTPEAGLMADIRRIEEPGRLEAVLQAAKQAKSLDDLRALINPPAGTDVPAS